jgi:hypothetical protein
MRRALPGIALLALGLALWLVLGRSGRGPGPETSAQPSPAPPVVVAPPASQPPPLRVRPARCLAGVERPLGGGTVAYAAYVRARTVVYRRPGRTALATFGALNANRFPMVFGVLGSVTGPRCQPLWYRVRLPLRPNGTIGYVPATAVRLARVDTVIRVRLSTRLLTLYRGGRAVLRTPVAVGKPSTPTPLGRYYVNQRLLAANPAGAYGPAALGVSAFSDVLTHWLQGGPIGIHGTNEPWLIGQAASNGCIRLPNATMSRLFRQVPAGTPVIISA